MTGHEPRPDRLLSQAAPMPRRMDETFVAQVRTYCPAMCFHRRLIRLCRNCLSARATATHSHLEGATGCTR